MSKGGSGAMKRSVKMILLVALAAVLCAVPDKVAKKAKRPSASAKKVEQFFALCAEGGKGG